MRRHLFQDFSLPSQPRDRSRALSEILAEEGIGADTRVGVIGWKTFADRSTLEVPAYIVDELRRMTPVGVGRERRAPAHRRRRRPARAQRGRAAGGVRGRGVPDLERRPPAPPRAAAGDARRRRRRAPRVERQPALVPPDALERRPGDLRPAQPDRPADRARRPVHGSVRDLGRPELPRGVRRRGRGRAPGDDPRLRRASWSGPTSRRSPSGTGPSGSARRAACCTRSCSGGSATRSSASS